MGSLFAGQNCHWKDKRVCLQIFVCYFPDKTPYFKGLPCLTVKLPFHGSVTLYQLCSLLLLISQSSLMVSAQHNQVISVFLSWFSVPSDCAFVARDSKISFSKTTGLQTQQLHVVGWGPVPMLFLIASLDEAPEVAKTQS